MKIISIILGLIIYLSVCINPVFAQETSYTYTNQEQDKSGLMHYDSRYYDPDLGRFLQPDSFDVPNKYAYVSNDPVNYTDPTGHFETPFFIDLSNTYIPDWQMDYGDTSSITAPAGSEFPLADAVELCCRIGSSLLPVDPVSAYDTGEYISEGKLGMAAVSGISIAGFGKWGKRMEGITKSGRSVKEFITDLRNAANQLFQMPEGLHKGTCTFDACVSLQAQGKGTILLFEKEKFTHYVAYLSDGMIVDSSKLGKYIALNEKKLAGDLIEMPLTMPLSKYIQLLNRTALKGLIEKPLTLEDITINPIWPHTIEKWQNLPPSPY